MTDLSTRLMRQALVVDQPLPTFLLSQFQTGPRNRFNDERVELDVKYRNRKIAIAVQSLQGGYRDNVADVYRNESLLPTVFSERAPLTVFDVRQRMMGETGFNIGDLRPRIRERAADLISILSEKILRSLELMAAQALTTGSITLTDENGVGVYTVDYGLPAALYPTVSTSWGAEGATPLKDLESLAQVIKLKSGRRVDTMVFGRNALLNFLDDPTVIQHFETRRLEQGTIGDLNQISENVSYHGVVTIGTERIDIWSYDGVYDDPQNPGTDQYYLPSTKVILMASRARRDALYGSCPNLLEPDPRLLNVLPTQVQSTLGIDIWPNVWAAPDGKSLEIAAQCRPVVHPTEAYAHGCLETDAS